MLALRRRCPEHERVTRGRCQIQLICAYLAGVTAVERPGPSSLIEGLRGVWIFAKPRHVRRARYAFGA